MNSSYIIVVWVYGASSEIVCTTFSLARAIDLIMNVHKMEGLFRFFRIADGVTTPEREQVASVWVYGDEITILSNIKELKGIANDLRSIDLN